MMQRELCKRPTPIRRGLPIGTAPRDDGFTGEPHDAVTGLVYLRARWYDPRSGTFLNRDPFPGRVTYPPSLHPYAYAYGNPLLYTDPDGRTPLVLALGGVVIGGTSLAIAGLIAVPVVLVGSVVVHPDGQRDLARGVDYVLAGGEGYVWRETLPPQAEIPDACTQSVDDVLVQAKGGKQNFKGDLARQMQENATAEGKDICTYLAEQRLLAQAAGNTRLVADIVKLEKAFGCRNKQKRKGK